MFLLENHLEKNPFFSDLAVGVISGLGSEGYLAAMRYAVNQKNL
jgi:3-dehydroquinate dehydratase-2